MTTQKKTANSKHKAADRTHSLAAQSTGRVGKPGGPVDKSGDGAAVHDMNAALENITAAIDAMAPGTGHRKSGAGKKNPVPHPSSLTHFSETPQPRSPLGTPNMPTVTPTGNTTIRVEWNAVANASGYTIKYATNNTFTENVQTVVVTGLVTTRTVTRLMPGTTYYFRVGANGSGDYGDSAFSGWKAATTLNNADAGNTAQLQSWLQNLQDISDYFATVMPDVGGTMLSPSDRRRMLGSGVRRYGFIDKVSDMAADFPQFWPSFVQDGEDRIKTLLREIEVLRCLMVFFESGARNVQDLLLIRGDEAFRIANTYYTTVRDAAHRGVPDAEALFQMLHLFWHSRRKTSENPTMPEVERDVHALLHGKAEGKVVVENEGDRIVKGKKVVIDNVRRAKRRATGAK